MEIGRDIVQQPNLLAQQAQCTLALTIVCMFLDLWRKIFDQVRLQIMCLVTMDLWINNWHSNGYR